MQPGSRLGLLVGLALWASTALLLVGTVRVGVIPTASAALLSLLVVHKIVGARRGIGVTVLAGLAMVLLVVVARVDPLVHGPLAQVVGSRAPVLAEVVLSGDPQQRPGRTSGSRRADDTWQVDAEVQTWRAADGSGVAEDVPVGLVATHGVAGLLPGTRVRVSARVLDGDPLRGRAATLLVESVQVVAGPPIVQGAAGVVRSALRASVVGRPDDEAALLPGLVVGDTAEVSAELDQAMRDSGLAHLTAVSGGNVAVVVLLALGLVRMCRVRRGRLQLLLVGVAILAYVVVARPQPSVLRAAGMAAVLLLSLLADGQVRPVSALGWSVGALVLLDPFLALSVGFAMSVLATGALVLLAGRVRARDPALGPWRARARAAWLVVLASAAAQVAVAPLVVGIGGGIPLGGVVANLLAEPAVVPATAFGLVAAMVGLVIPALAQVVAIPACWAVGWIALVARTTAERAGVLPWASGWGGALSLVLVLALGSVALLVTRRQSGPLPRLGLAVLAVTGVLVQAPPSVVPGVGVWPPTGWAMVMCDVGQGDALVLRDADASAVVVDTGPDPTAVDRCLRRLGVARVDLLVLTHFHADHVEGVPGVLRGRSVGRVVVSPLAEPVEEAGRVRRWLDDASVTAQVAAPGDAWTVGQVSLRVVWPTRILRGAGSDPNNASVTLVGTVGGVSVLLGGDLEPAAQDAVLAAGLVGHVDVVKVPHHGSGHQSPGWLAAARPSLALIGVGLGNDYGHPAPATVNAYLAAGVLLGRTDLDGDLAVVRDPSGRLGLVRRGR
jgi:competence protein ComEC